MEYINIAIISLLIILFVLSFSIQKKIDKNYKSKKINYNNLDILRYICAILIIILHLRPFRPYSSEVNFVFNNTVRFSVPLFFLIGGFFVGKKDNIKDYLKQLIKLYLIWSAIYIPVLIVELVNNSPEITKYISGLNIELTIPIIIVLIPIGLLIALLYTGVYYHLWYFPAVIISLFIIDKWKKKFNIKYLLIISFILLLIGSTETYWGIIPSNIQDILSYYYKYFVTTRNFLFFGLFYVTLGYYLGTKKEVYTKYSFIKLTLSIVLLILEVSFIHGIDRLNSNILISNVPVVYYLFVSSIYLDSSIKNTKKLRDYSKYYYLVHPIFILLLSILNIKFNNPYMSILIVLILTHLLSMVIVKRRN